MSVKTFLCYGCIFVLVWSVYGQSLRLSKGTDTYKLYKKLERRISKLQRALQSDVKEIKSEVVKSHSSLDEVLETVQEIEAGIKDDSVVPTEGVDGGDVWKPVPGRPTPATTKAPPPTTTRKPFLKRYPQQRAAFKACLSGESSCFLYDVIFVDNGEAIVVSDYRNEKLKKFSIGGKRIKELHLSRRRRPQGLASINSTHFAAAAPFDKSVLIVSSSDMEIASVIKLPDVCGLGLAIQSNKIITSCRLTKPPSVRVYDMEGNLEDTIDQNGRENYFQSPMHLTVGNDPNHIYVSDTIKRRVASVTRKGNLHFVHTGSSGGGDFYGLALDPDGDIYVTNRRHSRVEHITANGDFIRHLINERKSVHSPIAIHVTDEGKLVLVGQFGDVKVFDLV